MNDPVETTVIVNCDAPGTVSTEATTGGTDIGFGVATGVGFVVEETVIASNGTHGTALGGGRAPNPHTFPMWS